MSGLPGNNIAVAILHACGIDPDRVCALTFRSSVDDVNTLDVTYVLTEDHEVEMSMKRYRIVEVEAVA